MRARVTDQPFDPYAELSLLSSEVRHAHPGAVGGEDHFIGTMRSSNEGDAVRGMFLEHYPGMTESVLEQLCTDALSRWPVIECRIVHRVGQLHPDDAIVLVAVWAAHRGAAFEACRFLIEELKHRAPFWKKETLLEGERWVEQNTPG